VTLVGEVPDNQAVVELLLGMLANICTMAFVSVTLVAFDGAALVRSIDSCNLSSCRIRIMTISEATALLRGLGGVVRGTDGHEYVADEVVNRCRVLDGDDLAGGRLKN
jgi:hypothetical protein